MKANVRLNPKKLRQHRTILTAQICRQIFRQTNQIDAGNSGSIDKEICAVWRKRCKKLCGQGASRELRGGALSIITENQVGNQFEIL